MEKVFISTNELTTQINFNHPFHVSPQRPALLTETIVLTIGTRIYVEDNIATILHFGNKSESSYEFRAIKRAYRLAQQNPDNNIIAMMHITDEILLSHFRTIKRHEFAPVKLIWKSYNDDEDAILK